MLVGLPILIGTLLNGHRYQRVKESILLRTLGASAQKVRAIPIIEYATLGGLALSRGVCNHPPLDILRSAG